MMAVGSNDGTIKLWDAKTGKRLQTLDDDSELVHSAADQTPYKPNTQVSLADGWVTFGGQKLIRLPLEYRQFSCSATKDGTLALGYDDGRVFIVAFRTD
jgi:WD40 repeat protein